MVNLPQNIRGLLCDGGYTDIFYSVSCTQT